MDADSAFESIDYASLFGSSGMGAVLVSESFRIHYVNPAFAGFLRYGADYLLGRDLRDFLLEAFYPAMPGGGESDVFWSSVQHGFKGRLYWRLADGDVRPLALHLSKISAEHYLILGEVSADCSVFYENGRPCEHSLDHLPIATILVDHGGRIKAVNSAMSSVTGYSRGELIGRSPRILQSGRQDEIYYRDLWGTVESEGEWEGEIWDRRRNGEIFPGWLQIRAIKGADNNPYYIGTLVDLSDQSHFKRDLHYLAYYDMLTGLPNRHLLADRLEMAMRLAARSRQLMALLFIDLDKFKPINDHFGHGTGDRLLMAVAERLEGCLRGGDTVARYGGDEFVLLVNDIGDHQGVAQVAGKVVSAFQEPFILDDQAFSMTPSVGISLYPEDGRNADALLGAADRAMYRVKRRGSNGFAFFSVPE